MSLGAAELEIWNEPVAPSMSGMMRMGIVENLDRLKLPVTVILFHVS